MNFSSLRITRLLARSRAKTAAILASCAMFTCAAPVPALATESTQEEFCTTAVEYNLNWHKLLGEGVPTEQVVQWHLEVLEAQPNQLPRVLVDVVNKMLYLTVLNKETAPAVTKEGLSAFCNDEINRLKQSQKSSKKSVKI